MNNLTDELITVTTASSLGEAEMAKSVLETNNIQCFIHDEHTGATFGYSAAIGFIKIRVRRSQLEQAKELLGIKNVAELEASANLFFPPCPQCSSRKVTQKQRSLGFTIFSTTLFFVPSLLSRKKYTCHACHFTWQSIRPKEYFFYAFMLLFLCYMFWALTADKIWHSLLKDYFR